MASLVALSIRVLRGGASWPTKSLFVPILCGWSLRGVLFVRVLLSWAMSGTQARFISAICNCQIQQCGAGQADVRPLEPGKPIERDLAGGQSHSYQLTLAADQYLLVAVEQRGIDVVVQLLGPDDKQIMEFDSEIRDYGQEPVSQVAEVSGSYRLNLRPKQEMAQAGRYEIRVVELRAATERDRALQEGRQLLAEGVRLNRAAKYDEALPLMERALEIREKTLAPEDPLVAEALNSAGNLYRRKATTTKRSRSISGRWQSEKKCWARSIRMSQHLSTVSRASTEQGRLRQGGAALSAGAGNPRESAGPGPPGCRGTSQQPRAPLPRQGRLRQGGTALQRALAIREKAQGPDHPGRRTSQQSRDPLLEQRRLRQGGTALSAGAGNP